MTANGKQDQLRIGFLTAVQLPERGYVAGLLVTNRFGRPLEFQCTTPVKPNRTQELLYGPTLVPFILGELISRTLVEKVGVKPHLIITDLSDILELRNHVSIPVLCMADKATTPARLTDGSDDARPTGRKGKTAAEGEFTLGRQRFRIHEAHPGDREVIAKNASMMADEADLREPIDRVREALNETLGMGAAR